MAQNTAFSTGANETEQAISAAIRWMVLLRSGDATERDRQHFDAWRKADPAHAKALAHVEASLGALLPPTPAGVPRRAVGDAKLPAPSRRKLVRGALSFGAIALGAGAIVDRLTPIGQWTADIHTNTGERKETMLADGSTVTLGARSALDLAYNNEARGLVLRNGAALVRVANRDARPFVVRNGNRRVRAHAGSFSVRTEGQWLHVAALDTPLQISVAGGDAMTLAPGRTARAGRQRIEPLRESAAFETSWTSGQLQVDEMPLGVVVERLRPYFPGVIRVADDAASLPVTGVLPLDQPVRALDALAHTLPLQISRYAGYLVLVEHA
ncbi:FecR family protein [Trinickia sp.]|uniref:FecR family protein n=1 Tax=Trinickia sp. TaxID=2571163 RepID=UPI003F7E5C62